MLSYFKSQQPVTIVVFIIFFLVIKIPFIFGLHHDVIAPVQNLWDTSGVFLSSHLLLSFLLAQACLLIQAILFNFLFHKANYHEGSSMIPAIYFVLVSSLLPQFNFLSIYTVIGFVLLWMFQTLLIFAVKESTKLECFNLGFTGGILVILDAHFILFVPFLFLVLYVIKPFRFNEYIMLVFGIMCPLYVALSVSYICDFSVNAAAFSFSKFHFFRFDKDVLDSILLILALVYLLFSFVSLRGIMYSTGFKRRKNINMLIFLFTGLVVTHLFSGDEDNTALSVLFIPAGIFLALFMLRIRKKKLGEILNAIFVIAIFTISLVRIFK